MELVDDGLVTSLSMGDFANPRIFELSGQSASTKVEVILLMSNLHSLEEVRIKAKLGIRSF